VEHAEEFLQLPGFIVEYVHASKGAHYLHPLGRRRGIGLLYLQITSTQ